MSCCAGPVVAELAHDAQAARQAAARRSLLEELRMHARVLADGSNHHVLSVPAIHCGNCIATIEKGLAKLPGVSLTRANLSLRRVTVTLDHSVATLASVVDRLEDLGFPPQALTQEEAGRTDPELKSLLWALAVAGFATANIMLLSIPVWNGASGATRELFHFISALIAIPSVTVGGMPFFQSAVAALRHRRVNMDVPVSLGVVLATGMSIYESLIGGGHAYFDAAVSLLFFLLIGRTLDHMMRAKARAAADSLMRVAAKGGFVVGRTGDTNYLLLAALEPGMRIRVAVGERFPVDGTVIEGMTEVDRSIVTGESQPVRIQSNDNIEAGAMNLTGAVDIRATRCPDQSFIAEVTRMMAAAERGRGRYVRMADRLARIYAPFVHITAGLSFVSWLIWTHGDVYQSLTVAVAVLIITCPCALGLAVPVAQVISAGRLFQAGILMKDGSALERLAAITDVAFDKTGTLTTGTPAVERTALKGTLEESLAKALAQRSMHPASQALVKHLSNARTMSLTNMVEVAGLGIEAIHGGRRMRLGRSDWVAEIASPSARHDGSGSCFALEGGSLRVINLRENLRTGAHAVVAQLRQRGLQTRILSGDTQTAVAAIANLVDVTDFASELKPGAKLAALADAAAHGRKTLMVGDGLNDAPALAAAHVSMAPASAADVGRMAADLVFTRDSLDAVTFAHDVALATGRIVQQNFALAIAYNVLAVPMAVLGHLNPLLAAIAMSTSSIIVVGNSLRLYHLRPALGQSPRPKTAPETAQPAGYAA